MSNEKELKIGWMEGSSGTEGGEGVWVGRMDGEVMRVWFERAAATIGEHISVADYC